MKPAIQFFSRDGAVKVPLDLDHAGFRRWVTADDFPDGVNVAYIRGEVWIDMSPEEIEAHNKIKTALVLGVGPIIEAEDGGVLYSDRLLVSNVRADLSCEPDLTFVSWESFESGRVTKTLKANRSDRYVELVGAPDLVAEIVSDSSTKKDKRLLPAAWALAGVPEYWLIDGRGRSLHFEILQLRRGRYVRPSPDLGPQRSAVLERSFRLERSRDRLGDFRYRLIAV